MMLTVPDEFAAGVVTIKLVRPDNFCAPSREALISCARLRREPNPPRASSTLSMTTLIETADGADASIPSSLSISSVVVVCATAKEIFDLECKLVLQKVFKRKNSTAVYLLIFK